MTPGWDVGRSKSHKQLWLEQLAKDEPQEAQMFQSWLEAQVKALEPSSFSHAASCNEAASSHNRNVSLSRPPGQHSVSPLPRKKEVSPNRKKKRKD
eukprot:9509433-Karenia_brevis.AAC.1